MNLSPNFTLEEMTRSQTALRLGVDNNPYPEDVANLQTLCLSLLEPARTILGVPLHVDSGYRSPDVNTAVGGAIDSAHIEGRAADVIPIGMSLIDAFNTLRINTTLSFDQLIIECGAWLHISIAPAAAVPRRMAMTASGRPGNWSYTVV